MALQTKLQGRPPDFIPYPFELQKVRGKKKVEITSPPIPWSELNQQEFDSQWGAMLNAVHSYENMDIIKRDDLLPYFFAYAQLRKYTPKQIAKLRNTSEKFLSYSIVSKAFLLMTANVDHPGCNNTDRWLRRKINELLARNEEKPARTIADFKRDKCSDLIGELQGLEDDKPDVDIVAFLTERKVAKEYCGRIEERFRPRLEEYNELAAGTDEQLNEAYKHLNKAEVAGLISWYEKLLEAVAEYRDGKAAQRSKPVRIARPKDPAKVVKRVQYCKRDNELGLESIHPKKLVGAQQVFLYNVRTRQLMVYTASEHDKQLTVRGTTLHGWDKRTVASFQKRLRWPQDQLTEFMACRGAASSMKFLQGVKIPKDTSLAELRGRVNENLLILKAY